MSLFGDTKTERVAEIIRSHHPAGLDSILVVGCGLGFEAAILAQQLKASVVGIDLKAEFDQEAIKCADLRLGDAMALEFADESFDFVFSYHALEHIEDPTKALQEMNRVLKVGGGFWIGTPNRSRIVGYIGGKGATIKEKIRWNLMDWRARLGGRFKNELGAHAGFTSRELEGLISAVFPKVQEVTSLYFSTIYINRPNTINTIERSGLSRFIYPSVYFSGKK